MQRTRDLYSFIPHFVLITGQKYVIHRRVTMQTVTRLSLSTRVAHLMLNIPTADLIIILIVDLHSK